MNQKSTGHEPTEGLTDAKTEITEDKKHYALGIFDSPVIYGVRVETSNPYHLLYIEKLLNLQVKTNLNRQKSQVSDLDDLHIWKR